MRSRRHLRDPSGNSLLQSYVMDFDVLKEETVAEVSPPRWAATRSRNWHLPNRSNLKRRRIEPPAKTEAKSEPEAETVEPPAKTEAKTEPATKTEPEAKTEPESKTEPEAKTEPKKTDTDGSTSQRRDLPSNTVVAWAGPNWWPLKRKRQSPSRNGGQLMKTAAKEEPAKQERS